MRAAVEKKLENLENDDIIEKVEGPTPWISPIVIVPKSSDPMDVRLCVDMREANRAIQRERHLTPTIDDIICDLNGARIFSKLDLNQGYHQLELDKESRQITTFTTHVGLRRYKRLNFGISSAAEIFQNVISETISDIPNCLNISDDIIVFGKNQESHDDALHEVLRTLQSKGLTLNKKKCQFSQSRVKFFGYIFNEEGVSPDPEKVEGIKNAPAPTNCKELRSFLGMVNYCGRFIK